MSAGELPLAEARSPGALRSLGVGLRLAHVRFLRLFPLALLVGVALEAVAIATDTAIYWHLFGRAPAWLHDDPHVPRSVLLFLSFLLRTLGGTAPAVLTTALVTPAASELLRDRDERPLASLAAGVRVLPVALATTFAFSILPLAALCAPRTAGDVPSSARTFVWAVVLSLPLTAAVIGRWLFAVPAAALERRGLIAAWRRSERLVVGRQLSTFGLVLLGVASGFVAFEMVLPWLLATWALGPLPWPRVLEFGRVALSAWFNLCVATVTTVHFVELRRAKEGPDADELRAVFT
ncbi:MAG TPA: hypothetical protein VFG37_02815 [Planctomycetota bacterium]|jgi:hypothetical protein|nr:hypothetical protein [Planctomycetota bacterium]